MSLFLMLLGKIAPLYLLVAIGYVAGRFLRTETVGVGKLLLYVVGPAVIFAGLNELALDAARLALPLVFLAMCMVTGTLVFLVAGPLVTPERRGILAFAAGSGNTGYFGMPLTVFVLGEAQLGLAALALLGFVLYEYTLGYFLAARGQYDVKRSLAAVARVPMIYAALAGLATNALGWRLSGSLAQLAADFRGAFAVLGMMLIGLAIATLPRWRINLRFLALALGAKLVLWPLLALAVLAAESRWLGVLDAASRDVIALMAIVPLPAVSIAVAANLGAPSDEVALAVLVSTLVALFYIPLVWPLLT